MIENDDLSKIENLFLALADRTRLRLINLMRGGEVSVSWLVEISGESQPKISRHLAYLRNAGVVSTRREGKSIYYKIELSPDYLAAEILDSILNWLNAREGLQSEYRKLSEIMNGAEVSGQDERNAEHNISAKSDVTNGVHNELEIFLL